MDSPNRVLVRGVGDVGSAVAVILHRAGYGVALHDEPATPTPRRGMAFADAIFDGWATLDGLTAIRVQTPAELRHALNAGRMPNAPRSWTWARWAVIRRRSQLRRRSCRCSSGPQARTVQRQDRRPRRRVFGSADTDREQCSESGPCHSSSRQLCRRSIGHARRALARDLDPDPGDDDQICDRRDARLRT